MMNSIWCFMILFGLIVGSFNGKIAVLSDTILSSSKEAVELCILMFGIVGLWSGLMSIALSLGITTKLQQMLSPFLSFLFPNLKNKKAKEYISTNIIANMLGLGWAATPSGLKAMEELQKNNPHKDTATNEMCSFLILNISSLLLSISNGRTENNDHISCKSCNSNVYIYSYFIWNIKEEGYLYTIS